MPSTAKIYSEYGYYDASNRILSSVNYELKLAANDITSEQYDAISNCQMSYSINYFEFCRDLDRKITIIQGKLGEIQQKYNTILDSHIKLVESVTIEVNGIFVNYQRGMIGIKMGLLTGNQHNIDHEYGMLVTLSSMIDRMMIKLNNL